MEFICQMQSAKNDSLKTQLGKTGDGSQQLENLTLLKVLRKYLDNEIEFAIYDWHWQLLFEIGFGNTKKKRPKNVHRAKNEQKKSLICELKWFLLKIE